MKTYIKPHTTIVDVDTESLLADASFNNNGGTVTPGGDKEPMNPDLGAAKDNNYSAGLWYDYSEEDFDNDNEY